MRVNGQQTGWAEAFLRSRGAVYLSNTQFPGAGILRTGLRGAAFFIELDNKRNIAANSAVITSSTLTL